MLHHGDLFDVLPTLDEASVEACVTDPPYGIGFMGKEWDSFSPDIVKTAFDLRQRKEFKDGVMSANIKGRKRTPAASPSQIQYNRSLEGQRAFQEWIEKWVAEVLRVLKPGAYLLVCGAPRSFHRMACGIEDAGFEVRDCLSWLYGQGFPKSLNVGDGRGTALKPAWEPIVLARKPFKGTLKENLSQWGTGALNIDVCRIPTDDALGGGDEKADTIGRQGHEGWDRPWKHDDAMRAQHAEIIRANVEKAETLGRWPANVLLDEEAAALLDVQTGELAGPGSPATCGSASAWPGGKFQGRIYPGEIGGASRFYYVPKPDREERDYGCATLPQRTAAELTGRKPGSAGLQNPRAGIRAGSMDRDVNARVARNIHPTVKPVELMRWLVRLVTPPGGTVLDPFAGSGTTGMACRYEQREFIGIEREADYVQIAERRIAAVAPLFAVGE